MKTQFPQNNISWMWVFFLHKKNMTPYKLHCSVHSVIALCTFVFVRAVKQRTPECFRLTGRQGVFFNASKQILAAEIWIFWVHDEAETFLVWLERVARGEMHKSTSGAKYAGKA